MLPSRSTDTAQAADSRQVGTGLAVRGHRPGGEGHWRPCVHVPSGGHTYLVVSPPLLKNKRHVLFIPVATVSGGIQFPLGTQSRLPPFRFAPSPQPFPHLLRLL